MSRNRIRTAQLSIPFTTTDQATSSNATATVTYAAQSTNVSHVLSAIRATVSARVPLTGDAPLLTVKDGASNVVFESHLAPTTSVGSTTCTYVLDVVFPQPRKGTGGNAMTISVPAQGANTINKISCVHWTELS